MAKIAGLTLDGASGKEYAFNVYPFDEAFNKVKAVYAVTRRPNTKHTILYIGQTADLSVRFDSHHKISCFRRHKANCICVHQDKNEASRLAKEADLIEKSNPPCND